MKFVPMQQLLQRAVAEGYGVPSFCVWNAESIEVVLRVAAELKAPVILMNGPGEFGLLAPRDLGAVAHALAERFGVTGRYTWITAIRSPWSKTALPQSTLP